MEKNQKSGLKVVPKFTTKQRGYLPALDASLSCVKDLPFGDDPEKALLQKERDQGIQTILSKLRPREKIIIESYYGLEGEPKTLKQLGKEFNVVAGRIQQILRNAKAKFKRRACREGYYRSPDTWFLPPQRKPGKTRRVIPEPRVSPGWKEGKVLVMYLSPGRADQPKVFLEPTGNLVEIDMEVTLIIDRITTHRAYWTIHDLSGRRLGLARVYTWL